MTFSIIVTTYNRPFKVVELANELISILDETEKLIVVDSSEMQNDLLRHNDRITYLTSSHKNQPYQRYLGYRASNAKISIFLDDDMEILDTEFLEKLRIIFVDESVVGVAINFKNKHEDTLLAQIPPTRIFKKKRKIRVIKNNLSGFPQLADGKFGLCGNKGIQPPAGGPTEWLSGGAFAARRSALFKNFNFQLLDIFEKRLGMGEDGIIGYGLSKQGRLIYHNELFFLHNDQKDSTYTIDTYGYAQRVAFSRLYLSLEKYRLDNRRHSLARIHYHYYMFWRLSGLVLSCILQPDIKRTDLMRGTLRGWRLASQFTFAKENSREHYWTREALNDLS